MFSLIIHVDMVAIMIGSSVFKILVVKFHVVPESLGKYIFAVAAVSLFAPVVLTVCVWTPKRNYDVTKYCLLLVKMFRLRFQKLANLDLTELHFDLIYNLQKSRPD